MRPLPRYRETRPWRGRSSTVSALVVVTGYMTSSPFSWAAAHPFLPSPRGHPKTWAWVVFRDARSKSRNPYKWITSFIFHRTTILLPFCIKISKGGKNMNATTTSAASPAATTTGNSGSGSGSATSSPLLFFVALGFGVVFTNLWYVALLVPLWNYLSFRSISWWEDWSFNDGLGLLSG